MLTYYALLIYGEEVPVGGGVVGKGIFKNDNFIMKKIFKMFWSPVLGNISF